MMMNDVNKELRRTKRALWMMKALYFYIMMLYAQMLARVAHEKIFHDSNMFPNPTDKCREVYQHEANIFDDARIRCLNFDERGSRKKQIAYFMVSQKFENLHNNEKQKWRKENERQKTISH